MVNKTYRDPITGGLHPERRSGIDRREPSSFFDFLSSQKRRRKSRGRRKTDGGAYVDLYGSRTWGIVIAILCLSLMDAVLTVFHMRMGTARELNPILEAVIVSGGLPAFFCIKAAMTIFPVAIIMIHKEWTVGKYAARLCLWAYILLACYHMYLILGIQIIKKSQG